jgi:hypothetical protein
MWPSLWGARPSACFAGPMRARPAPKDRRYWPRRPWLAPRRPARWWAPDPCPGQRHCDPLHRRRPRLASLRRRGCDTSVTGRRTCWTNEDTWLQEGRSAPMAPVHLLVRSAGREIDRPLRRRRMPRDGRGRPARARSGKQRLLQQGRRSPRAHQVVQPGPAPRIQSHTRQSARDGFRACRRTPRRQCPPLSRNQ